MSSSTTIIAIHNFIRIHGGIRGGHFSSNIIVQKILNVDYWWSMMNWDVHEYCWTYDECQKTSNMLTQNLVKLVTNYLKRPFQKWGLDFIRIVKPTSKMLSNQYVLVAINYATKWVEAWTIHTNIIVIITEFL